MFPDGEVQYLHPKDGVYPEKVNAGREAVGANDRSIGKNPQPVSVRTLLWLICVSTCPCRHGKPPPLVVHPGLNCGLLSCRSSSPGSWARTTLEAHPLRSNWPLLAMLLHPLV